jgi:C-8 sterol isomerase
LSAIIYATATAMAVSKSTSQTGGMSGLLKVLAILIGLLVPALYIIERNLDSFYIFDPAQLHDLQLRAIKQHGNDTRALVQYIVNELNGQANVAPYMNQNEDWFFNNAGGAMGGVRLLHASKLDKMISTWKRASCN